MSLPRRRTRSTAKAWSADERAPVSILALTRATPRSGRATHSRQPMRARRRVVMRKDVPHRAHFGPWRDRAARGQTLPIGPVAVEARVPAEDRLGLGRGLRLGGTGQLARLDVSPLADEEVGQAQLGADVTRI